MYYNYNLNQKAKIKIFEECSGHRLVNNPSLTKSDMTNSDVVFVERESDKKLFEGYKVICWEELEKACVTETQQRIDYAYLRCQMKRAKDPSTSMLVIGSSYMQFGFNEVLVDNCVNLSLSGMDIYYCDKIIRNVCDANPNIKYVLIGGGYYYFYADMSRNSNNICQHITSQALYPIFKDMHNSACISPSISILPHSSIINVDQFFEFINDSIWRSNHYDYFFPNRNRQFCRLLKNARGEIISWMEYEDRAGKCESFVKNEAKYYSHQETYEENVAIFHRLMDYFKLKDITPVIIQFPGSKCGYEQGTLEYREQFYDTLNLFEECPIHVIDFMGLDIFEETDFSDASHLSDEGANKVTELIIGILEEDIIQ